MSKFVLIYLNFNLIDLSSQHELIRNRNHLAFHLSSQLYLLILKMMFLQQLTTHPQYAG